MRHVDLSKFDPKEVRLEDGELFIGDKKVIKQQDSLYTAQTVPALFTIRFNRKDDETIMGRAILATTLDLMDDGYIWICSFYRNHDYTDAIPETFHKKWENAKRMIEMHPDLKDAKSWDIYEEEDFDAHYEWYYDQFEE